MKKRFLLMLIAALLMILSGCGTSDRAPIGGTYLFLSDHYKIYPKLPKYPSYLYRLSPAKDPRQWLLEYDKYDPATEQFVPQKSELFHYDTRAKVLYNDHQAFHFSEDNRRLHIYGAALSKVDDAQVQEVIAYYRKHPQS